MLVWLSFDLLSAGAVAFGSGFGGSTGVHSNRQMIVLVYKRGGASPLGWCGPELVAAPVISCSPGSSHTPISRPRSGCGDGPHDPLEPITWVHSQTNQKPCDDDDNRAARVFTLPFPRVECVRKCPRNPSARYCIRITLFCFVSRVYLCVFWLNVFQRK